MFQWKKKDEAEAKKKDKEMEQLKKQVAEMEKKLQEVCLDKKDATDSKAKKPSQHGSSPNNPPPTPTNWNPQNQGLQYMGHPQQPLGYMPPFIPPQNLQFHAPPVNFSYPMQNPGIPPSMHGPTPLMQCTPMPPQQTGMGSQQYSQQEINNSGKSFQQNQPRNIPGNFQNNQPHFNQSSGRQYNASNKTGGPSGRGKDNRYPQNRNRTQEENRKPGNEFKKNRAQEENKKPQNEFNRSANPENDVGADSYNSGQMKHGGGSGRGGSGRGGPYRGRGGFRGIRGKPFCNRNSNQEGLKDSNDRRTNFKRINRKARSNQGQKEESDSDTVSDNESASSVENQAKAAKAKDDNVDSSKGKKSSQKDTVVNMPDVIKPARKKKEKKVQVEKPIVPPEPQILSKTNLGPDNVLKNFIGTKIPSLLDAITFNIDLNTQVKDVILMSDPSTKTPVLETPKKLIDILNFKMKFPDAKSMLL